jgi:drug/metabolite transporter (DMT)-like permease
MKTGLLMALAVAVTGQVLYHVTQKTVAEGAHPVLSLIVFYAVAAAATLPLFWLFPLKDAMAVEFGKLNWAVAGVAISIVLIEIGFLLAYRAGGELSTSFVMTAAVVTISTFLIGAMAFGETVTAVKLGGIALCMAGIGLLTWKPV